jgi:hypothetical protein
VAQRRKKVTVLPYLDNWSCPNRVAFIPAVLAGDGFGRLILKFFINQGLERRRMTTEVALN